MDVTLACEQDQISAHKVVLSACSSFFKTILKRNPHQHPLLYLRGISYSNIESLINFMYYGEVSIAQEELNSFLAVAEELQVKGLTQSESPKPSQPQSIKSKAISRSRIPPVQKAIDIDNDVDIEEVPAVKLEPDASNNAVASYDEEYQDYHDEEGADAGEGSMIYDNSGTVSQVNFNAGQGQGELIPYYFEIEA